MRVLVKSAPKTNNFLAKINHGTNLIEVQLTEWFTTDEMLKESMREDMDIINVHTPLLENKDDQLTDGVNLDEFVSPFTRMVLLDSCNYAEQLALYYKHDIKMIVHNSWSRQDWEKSQLVGQLAEFFAGVIEKYPHLTFAIENITPLTKFGFRSGCFPEDAAFLAKQLNKKLKTKKFSTVIDICHLLMTNYTIETVAPDSEHVRPLCLFEMFEQSDNMCSVIHLNNKIDNGMGKNHGTPFTDSKADIVLLQEILENYQTYAHDADIVVEVKEDDYLNCVNCRQTIKTLEVANKLLENPEIIVLTK